MIRITAYFLACTISYIVGALSVPVTSIPSPLKRDTPPMTIALTNTAQSIKAYPIDIKLRIVDAKEFNKSLTVSMLKATQQMNAVGAYTLINNNPCEIILPDDFKIDVLASKGAAWFSSETGDTLAHEILHCLYGVWHQPWNKIESRSRTASSGESVSPPWTKRITGGLTTPPQSKTP